MDHYEYRHDCKYYTKGYVWNPCTLDCECDKT